MHTCLTAPMGTCPCPAWFTGGDEPTGLGVIATAIIRLHLARFIMGRQSFKNASGESEAVRRHGAVRQAADQGGGGLPPPRPVLWPLRPLCSADIDIREGPDGRRCITIRHAELNGVTPGMLAWWFAHVDGEMDYAGGRWPRYLVWHPLDHISYHVVARTAEGAVASGARLRIREALQRARSNLLDVTVKVERIDRCEAIICRQLLGLNVLRLVNRFEPTRAGTRYVSELTIGAEGLAGRLGFNRAVRARVLPGDMALAWARHHVEEVGNLEYLLPRLCAMKPPSAAEPADGWRQGS
jgi:hypothetical protein